MTIYAHVTAGTVDAVGQPPQLVFQDGRWWDLRPLDPATLAAVGWLPVTDTARPADTATHTTDRSIQLVSGVPTVVWTSRPKTADELAAAQRGTTLSTLATRARTAVDTTIPGHITQGGADRANATLGAFVNRNTTITTAVAVLQAEAAANRAATQDIIRITNRLSLMVDFLLKAMREQIYLDGEFVAVLRDLANGQPPAP